MKVNGSQRSLIAIKLLIFIDEPFTVDMVQTFLEINGFETVGSFNGEDGLVLVKSEQPELLILDLMLPDIEGYEVCERIRAYPPTASLPVLVVSAKAEPLSKERAFAAGADGYLVKPIQFPQLLTELNRLLAKRPSQVATADVSAALDSGNLAAPENMSTATVVAPVPTIAKAPEPISTSESSAVTLIATRPTPPVPAASQLNTDPVPS